MPQLAVTAAAVPGVPGMPFMTWNDIRVRHYVAGATIQPGTLCEIVSGKAYPCKDSGTTTTFLPALLGVAMFDPAMENSYVTTGGTTEATFPGYAAKAMVPFAFYGEVWVQCDVTTSWPDMGVVNIKHSSTGANDQGVFTTTAAQTTAGNEIDALESNIRGVRSELAGTFVDGFNQSVITAVVMLNLPGGSY
jgi:hypothetical protein